MSHWYPRRKGMSCKSPGPFVSRGGTGPMRWLLSAGAPHFCAGPARSLCGRSCYCPHSVCFVRPCSPGSQVEGGPGVRRHCRVAQSEVSWFCGPQCRFNINRLRGQFSNPYVIGCGPISSLFTCVGCPARLDQEKLHLSFRIRLVFDPLGHDEHFSRRHSDLTVAEIQAQRAVQDQESLIGVLMMVPDKIAFEFGDLELIVVHFGDNSRLPLRIEQPELLGEVERSIVNAYFSWRLSAGSKSKPCLDG